LDDQYLIYVLFRDVLTHFDFGVQRAQINGVSIVIRNERLTAFLERTILLPSLAR
jgi:hypothetical protein